MLLVKNAPVNKTVICPVYFLLWVRSSVYNIAYYVPQPLQLVGVYAAVVRFV